MGALVAKSLSEAGKRVLILEAGRASGLSIDGYQSYVDTFHSALPKVPNSPFPPNPMAPSPYATDIINMTKGTPDLIGYQVELGPLAFASTYLRTLGGTSMHWLGTCPRMVPSDFRLNSQYGVGVDWPISYDDLQPYYCQAEWAMGVSGNKEDQEFFGMHFPPDYNYPMERIPQSYSDQVLAQHVDGTSVAFGDQSYPVWVSSLPQARNSIPRGDYQPVGAVGAPRIGLRCEGNASCIPICPVQAKYNAVKTLAKLEKKFVTLQTQSVVTELVIAANGRVDGLKYTRYFTDGGPAPVQETARGKIYVLAAHAVENAMLLLASNAANASDQVGRNLMDHPFFLTWAMAPMNLGMFRGPGQTSGIESFRDGAFRREFSAFRIDLGNWGWDVATFPPNSDVTGLVGQNVFGKKLRDTLSDEIPRQLRVGFVIEQLPEPGNRVTISREYMDTMGIYRPVLSYNVSDYTRKAMLAALEVSRHVYHAMGIADDQIKTAFTPSSPGHMTCRDAKGNMVDLSFIGSGHHMGTHRMGVSPTNSVVNRYQRSWDHDNLYVVGCGSMPTSGSANPTLTGAALSLMAAEDMLGQL
jgi:choline dehydrogenase-like flavoprotein